MSYRLYHSIITTNTRSSRATAKVRVYSKNLSLTHKKYILDGTDPIRIFDFLAGFVDEGDVLNISKA